MHDFVLFIHKIVHKLAGVAGFEPTNDGVRGDFEGKISSDLPKNPRSNSDGFTANSMKNTLKMPDFCFSFSVTHFCNTSQHFPNIRSRNKALPFHARRCQCCHTSRVCSEEYAFFIVCNNNRKIVFLIELAHVVIPVRFQSGDDLGELRLGAPMDSTLLHKNTSCVLFHKEVRKKPIVRRAFGMRFCLPIGQPLAPCKRRLPCGHRGCPSRTLYGENSITEITLYVKQNF